jgi:hypothetical protein
VVIKNTSPVANFFEEKSYGTGVVALLVILNKKTARR